MMDLLKKEILEGGSNETLTENGAVSYKTTGRGLLDLSFKVPSLRSLGRRDMMKDVQAAYNDGKILFAKFMFYLRDCRMGLGERHSFREMFACLSKLDESAALATLGLIPEFGRWDDLTYVMFHTDDGKIRKAAMSIIASQLIDDMDGMRKGESVSLLAKWLPSVNAGKESGKMAAKIAKMLGLTKAEYRKTLSALRRHMGVVECKMCANEWGEIDYSKVPSCANIKYSSAFALHDAERRAEWLGKVKSGEAKINASVLYPHDIYHKYAAKFVYDDSVHEVDDTLEALWKALPDTVEGCPTTLVVCDGSGSMQATIDPKGGVMALDVSRALAIYFAERCEGEYKNKFITFSSHPEYVDVSPVDGDDTLARKIAIAESHYDCSNTDIVKVFDLILNTAIDNGLKQEDLPGSILIVSDMEFDWATNIALCPEDDRDGVREKLFATIRKKYADHGYGLPKLVFWNVNSRSGAIPMISNDLGLILVSGFSTNICKMVMSQKLDPYEALRDALNVERYDCVEKAIESFAQAGPE